MEEQRFFKSRHPLSAAKRQRLGEVVIPHGQPFEDDFDGVPETEQFQNIGCGTKFVAEFIIGTLLNSPQKHCPHCRDNTLLAQAEVMGVIETDAQVTDEQRYNLIKRAISGFVRDGQQQSAILALRQMLLLPQFRRLINNREYGKDISLIEYAIAFGDENALLALIDAGVHVNTSSFLMRTPLHFAVERRKVWAISVLLDHGADHRAHHYYAENALAYCQRLLLEAQEDFKKYFPENFNPENFFSIQRWPTYGDGFAFYTDEEVDSLVGEGGSPAEVKAKLSSNGVDSDVFVLNISTNVAHPEIYVQMHENELQNECVVLYDASDSDLENTVEVGLLNNPAIRKKVDLLFFNNYYYRLVRDRRFQFAPADFSVKKCYQEKRREIVLYTEMIKILAAVANNPLPELDVLEQQIGNRGENQLHFAVRLLDVQSVLHFLRAGVNPNNPDNSGFNPLMTMFSPLCYEDNTLSLMFFEQKMHEHKLNAGAVLERLKKAGVIVCIEPNIYRIEYGHSFFTRQFQSPLLEALSVTRHVYIARMLFDCTELTLVNNSHKNIFYYAVTSHNQKLCLELFKVAATKIENFYEYCCTALVNMFFSPRSQEIEISFFAFRLFLRCCQELSNPDEQLSILHIAVRIFPETNETAAFISWLVYAETPFAEVSLGIKIPEGRKMHFVVSNMDVNEVDSEGESAVFLAIRLNKLSFLKHLAASGNGADFTQRNNNGEFPLNIAREMGNDSVIEFVHRQSQDAINDALAEDACGEAEQALMQLMHELTEEQTTQADDYRREQAGESSSMEISSEEEEGSDQEESASPRFRR